MAPTWVSLKTQQQHTLLKFSPTIPTTTMFTGPLVTPLDITTGYIRLPIVPLPLQNLPTKEKPTTPQSNNNSAAAFFLGNHHYTARFAKPA